MIKTKFPKKNIKFYKRAHRYILDGTTELTSVNTWLKSFFEPFDEYGIACGTAANQRKQGIQTTARQVLKDWKKARTDGSKVHKEIEDHINKNTPITSVKAKHGYNFLKSFYPVEALLSEQVIYDGSLGLAGTPDMVVENDDGTLTILDWKTNRKIYQQSYKDKKGFGACANIPDCNYYHYVLQMSTYAYILHLKGFVVKNCILVHLTDDKAIPYEFTPNYTIIDSMLAEKNGHKVLGDKNDTGLI